jgi:predicted flap endonuclease-1-like 5' DNA nuclease
MRIIFPIMSAKAVFAGVLLLFVFLTLAFPGFPPGQLLYSLLNAPQITFSLWVIPVANLLNGIINGLFWGIITAAIYSLSMHLAHRKPLTPLPIAPELPSPPPKPPAIDWQVDKIPPLITVRKERPLYVARKGRIRMEKDIETIEGVGTIRGEMLRDLGVETVGDLLRIGATRRGRHRLATEVGVAYSTMLKWVYRGDLLRIRGVGKQYSELLESAGVTTVADLSSRDPYYLWKKLRTINKERRLVRRTPPSRTIRTWVNNAKKLEPIIE